MTLITILQAISAIIVVILILLQERSSGGGALFGGGGGAEFYQKRRGFEKLVFNLTIVFASVLVVLSIINLLV
jgi:protein translocase SecG subunit